MNPKPKKLDNSNLESVGILLNIEDIKLPKRQPRRSFNAQKMTELTESIKKYGILEPLIVRNLNNNKYELVAGERRYRAAQEANLAKIPVIVKQLDEQQAFELALLENMQRDDLNPIDETEGMLELICQALNITTEEVISILNRAANAQRRNQTLTDNVIRQIENIDNLFMTIGRLNRESFRTNRLPLLNLPEDVLEVLRQGSLDYTKAKAIAKLENVNHRKELMNLAIEEKLSLKKIKEKIREYQPDSKNKIISPKVEKTKPTELINFPKNSDKSQTQVRDLYSEFKSFIDVKSDAWYDETKKNQIEQILEQLKKILI